MLAEIQAEQVIEDLLRKNKDLEEWANSTENPAFDAGWEAGRKRANIDLQRRVRELEEEISDLHMQKMADRTWQEFLDDKDESLS